jgi:hypothetical protein
MIRIDLHTHSNGSPDGGIHIHEYKKILDESVLDCIAITDHDAIDQAVMIQKQLGDRIIVGQEISTQDGEIIGLFLTQKINPGLNAKDTATAIKAQGGLVYIPHPFETVRKGISKVTLDSIANEVDIIEVHNGRAVFQNKGPQAITWARLHNVIGAASSDAHGFKGLGTTYTSIAKMPSRKTLITLLQKARLTTKRPPLLSLLYPKINRLRGKIGA